MKRLLLIEDDPFFLRQIEKAIMGRFDSVALSRAVNREEMERVLEEGPFDLVIADLILPDSDGEHVEALVERGERVIVMTGQDDHEAKERIYRLDIVDFIVKSEAERFEYLLRLIERLVANRGRRVLIVEDSRSQRAYCERILKVQNLDLLTAADGMEALEILEKETVHLVLSDYEMPRMDGLALLRQIRKKKAMMELPFIAVSAAEESDIVATFLKHGANDYLKKPFGKEELICRLNNTLDALDMLDRIKAHAIVDPLTSLKNRRYLHEIAPKMLATARRHTDQSLAVAVFDIDFFKRVNDTYGHLVGDIVLKTVARALDEQIRASDVAIRFGGEEFVILMPNTDAKRAFIVAEKLRRRVETLRIDVPGERPLRVSVSAGVAQYREGMDLEALLKQADRALYRAKASGRNRVEIEE